MTKITDQPPDMLEFFAYQTFYYPLELRPIPLAQRLFDTETDDLCRERIMAAFQRNAETDHDQDQRHPANDHIAMDAALGQAE